MNQGFLGDTEATTPKITLLAKSAAKLAKIAQSSAAANAGSFVEQNPDQIELEECLTITSNAETNACNSGVKRSSRSMHCCYKPLHLIVIIFNTVTQQTIISSDIEVSSPNRTRQLKKSVKVDQPLSLFYNNNLHYTVINLI